MNDARQNAGRLVALVALCALLVGAIQNVNARLVWADSDEMCRRCSVIGGERLASSRFCFGVVDGEPLRCGRARLEGE